MSNPFGNPFSLPHGRPKLHPVEQRTERVSCYLDGQERGLLRSAALKLKTTEAKLLRQAAIELAERILAGHAKELPVPQLHKKKRLQKNAEQRAKCHEIETVVITPVDLSTVELPFPVEEK